MGQNKRLARLIVCSKEKTYREKPSQKGKEPEVAGKQIPKKSEKRVPTRTEKPS